MPVRSRAPPKLLMSTATVFRDVARKVVSIINPPSVRAIEKLVGSAGPSASRFRAKLYVEGWPAGTNSMLDRTLAIGDYPVNGV